MKKSLLSQIAPYLLVFYGLSLAAFFAYALLTFSVNQYLPSLRMGYSLDRAFVLFMDYLIPVHAAAVAVAASLAGREQARLGAPAQRFSKIVSSTLVAFLLLTVAYTALYEGVYPRARARLSDMQYQSRLAQTYRKQAAERTSAGDFGAAIDAIDLYLAIDPGNKEMAEQRLVVAGKAVKQPAPAPAPSVEGAASAEESAEALIEKARSASARQDWYSANYYAQYAASLDPRRADAQRLASQAENMLSAASGSKDVKTSELFLQKRQAYSLLMSGDPLAAYYSFIDLAARDPKDPDITTYLAEASNKLKAVTFFVEDARKMETLPGAQGILFLNNNDAEGTEAVYLGKMVELTTGEAYFFDIEAIRYDAAGAVTWHFRAPYGMRTSSNAVLMHCISAADRKIQYLPQYLRGSRPEGDRNVLVMRPTLEELRALSTSRDALAVMGIAELWRLRTDLGSFGLARQTLTVDMAMQMLMPFAFLILSVLCVSLGWAFRSRHPGRLPFSNVLLMPLVPVVLALLSLLYLYVHRIIIGFVVLGFGFAVALVAVGVLQLALLAVALVLLAGQSAK